jgi:hypothetical protein
MGADAEAFLEGAEGVRGGEIFHLGPVFAAVSAGGMEESGVEGGFVTEEKKALALGVEAADGVDVRREAKIREGGPGRAGLRGELGKDAVGFVKGEEHGREEGIPGKSKGAASWMRPLFRWECGAAPGSRRIAQSAG